MRKRSLYFLINLFVIILIISAPFSAFANHRDNGIEDAVRDLDDDIVVNLPIPVLFGVDLNNLTKNFGDPRVGHLHEGLDLLAPEGTPIVAPTEAVVVRTGDGSGSGLYVTTAVPGDESFVYMHLSEIAVDEGDVLEMGDLIGYVGHTGNAVAAVPHLHFEIRDEDREPKDPYPRFTKTFTLAEKMEYLDQILEDADDEEELALFMVTKFRGEFVAAQALQIKLPNAILEALAKLPVPVVVSGSSSGTLVLGSRGPAVVVMQTLLIARGVGSATRIVADGAFGPMTRQALIDYQRSVGLTADGVYGPRTKASLEGSTSTTRPAGCTSTTIYSPTTGVKC